MCMRHACLCMVVSHILSCPLPVLVACTMSDIPYLAFYTLSCICPAPCLSLHFRVVFPHPLAAPSTCWCNTRPHNISSSRRRHTLILPLLLPPPTLLFLCRGSPTDRGHFASHLKCDHGTSNVQSRDLTGRRLRLSPSQFGCATPHRR